MKKGRPPISEYDAQKVLEDLIGTVVKVYRQKQEIKATAVELDLEPQKVKKLLVTAGELCYPETETILSYKKQGKTLTEIQEIMQLGRSSVNAYLPYSKAVYKSEEISRNAERVKCYRKRKEAVEKLQEKYDGRKAMGLHCCFSPLSFLYSFRLTIHLHSKNRPEQRIYKGIVY